MKKQSFESIKLELLNYAKEEIKYWKQHQELEDYESADVHHNLFNDDYWIIGYHQCSEWLKKHNVGEFESIKYILEMEQLHYGETHLSTDDINSEKVVNLLIYFVGLEIENEIESLYNQIKHNVK